MKRSRLLYTAIICVLSQPIANNVYAAGPWYLGGGIGTSKTNAGAGDIQPNLAAVYAPSSTSVDDKDNGWKVFMGYQFNRNLAGELSYSRLGKFTLDATTTTPSAGTLSASVEPDAYCLSGVGRTNPVNNFYLLGRAGVCRWDDNYKGTFTSGGPVSPTTATTTGTGGLAGIGVGYKLNSTLSLHAGWERYFSVVHDNKDADLLSASILYRF